MQAGAGGDGCTSFRREAHVPRGGPDGGDGGRGGDVLILCEDSLRDLQAFRRRSHFRAGRGGHGEGSQRHGADGQTLIIGVPPGTEVTASVGEGDDLSGRRWELLAEGQRATVARGVAAALRPEPDELATIRRSISRNDRRWNEIEPEVKTNHDGLNVLSDLE